jgi:hypothetical protein
MGTEIDRRAVERRVRKTKERGKSNVKDVTQD